ncbi:MAG TPA: peptidylprolyl isomerase [Flavobacteriia bacterium]|nr:peptidylprolyl isomerase [Flavobacteriia bacterium]
MNRMRIIILGLLFLNIITGYAQEKRIKVDGIAAVVADQIVLNSEIGQLKLQLKQQGLDAKNLDDCKILERLLQNKLLQVEAKKDTLITVNDKEIENMVNQQIDYMKTQMGGSIDKVLEFYNKKTLAELKAELTKLDKNKKLAEQMRQKITKDVDISPEEVKKFYDDIPKDKVPEIGTQVELQQIIIKPRPDKEAEQKVIDKLKDIKKKVENGASFRSQAVLYSEDPGSRANGGKYVINRKSAFVQEFKDVAFSLDKGQVSEPFKTQFGWHILTVEEINGQERVVRHILMVPEINFLNRRAAEKKLDTIRKRILDKELTFAEAAKAFSNDEETKKTGGTIINPNTGESMLELTMLDANMHQLVQDMKEGEMTEVLTEKDRTGQELYKLIRVSKRIEAHKMDYVKDYPKIKELALEQKKEKVLIKWMNEKIKNNYVKINPEFQHCKFDSNWKK